MLSQVPLDLAKLRAYNEEGTEQQNNVSSLYKQTQRIRLNEYQYWAEP